ncbi:glycosyltransferase family 2 protein [Synechococcus elongatus]|uniref:glycosyltransferase family 2 protein n=1 Tax=Synechococcus elongatus TaxID=32046 RepID=UPI000F7F8334|nr:glycosyltransferase family 2 protein [Synechococcus elongatus]
MQLKQLRKLAPEISFLLIAGLTLLAILLLQFDWQNAFANLIGLWYSGQALFKPEGSTLENLLYPAFVWLAITFLLKELSPQPSFWPRLITSIGIAVLGIRYELWRFFGSLNLDDPLNGTLSVLLFFAELLTVVNTIAFFLHTIFSYDRSPEADILSQAVISQAYQPSVDIILPTYNEGVDILRRSVIACQAMDYSNKKVFLLDDTRRPEVRALAEELGCGYFDRPDNKHAKAGNINHALPYLSGELLVVFDADFVPSKNFLIRTIGFFQDPKTGLLQTPQHFFNEDPISVNLGLEGILNNEQNLFFRFIQPSRDYFNSVICCGTCFVIRRSALDEIGGIPTESITEDYFTSIKLQTHGYRVKYLNEALAAGLAPETISAYVNQRLRWGQGTLQSLFTDSNFLTVPGLNWQERLSQSLSIVYWFLSIPRVVFLVVPLAFLIFGLAPLRATVNEILYFFLPYYIANIMAFSWLTEGRRSAFWSDVYETIICVPMAITILRTLVSPKGKPFKVTPKGDTNSDGITINWSLITPLLTVMILTIIGIVMRSSSLQDTNVNPDSLAINIVWAVYNLSLLLICILVAIDVPQRRHTRFSHEEACELRLGAVVFSGVTEDLSEEGGRILLNRFEGLVDIEDEAPQTTLEGIFRLRSPSPLADMPIHAEVRWHDRRALAALRFEAAVTEVEVRLYFSNLTLAEQRRLIPYLYCQPGQWQDLQVPEFKTAWAMLQSVFRLHPLANSR